MIALEDFLDRLEGVQNRHGYHVALCPAHDDQVTSLSIKEEDGKLLVLCHAGCKADDIRRAMELPWAAFFSEDLLNDDEPEVVYRYVDENHALLFEVCRFADKKFRQRRPDGSWGLGLARRVLYRLPEVLKAQKVYLVEGEKDADEIFGHLDGRLHGDTSVTATCNPMGAGKWRDEYTQTLTGKQVIIVADRDDPGRNHAERVAGALEGFASTVEIVMPKTGKDAYDHLQAGFGLGQFIPYKGRSKQGGMVFPFQEVAENAIADRHAKKEDVGGYPGPWRAVKEIEFVPGRLYVIGGYTGDHKSAFCLQSFRHLVEQGIRGGYFTLEMPERDVRNRFISHKGVDLWLCDHPWLLGVKTTLYDAAAEEIRTWDGDIIADAGADARKIEEYQKDGEYDFIVVDHLHRIDRDGEENQIAREVRAFKTLALNFNIPVLLVSQLRRPMPGAGNPSPGLHDFKGSSGIEQEADMALSVWSHRDPHGKPDGTGACDITILKNRHGAEYEEPFWFNKTNGLLVCERDLQEEVTNVDRSGKGDAEAGGSPGNDGSRAVPAAEGGGDVRVSPEDYADLWN